MPLKLTRRAGSSVWWITGTVNGRRIRESTGCTDEGKARDWLRKADDRAHRAAIYGEEAVVLWGDALASYLSVVPTKPSGAALLDRLDRVLDGKLLREIDQLMVDRAVRLLCRPGAAPATKQRNVIGPLKAVLNHAARRGWCKPPAFETPKGAGGVKRTRWLTPDEATRLMAKAAPHLRPLVLFLLGTGVRLSEALELDWQAVDLNHARAVVWQKQGNERTLTLPPAVVVALANLPGREGRVFLTDDGRPYRDTGRTSGGQIKVAFAGACRRAKVAGVTPHTLRHTWASWRYADLRDPMALRDEGGWSTITQVERYAKLVPDTMLDGIREVWGKAATDPALRLAGNGGT